MSADRTSRIRESYMYTYTRTQAHIHIPIVEDLPLRCTCSQMSAKEFSLWTTKTSEGANVGFIPMTDCIDELTCKVKRSGQKRNKFHVYFD